MPGPSDRVLAVQDPVIPRVADWVRANPGTLSLGQGVAGYPPPPEALQELERLAREPLLHRYQPVEGLPELQDALTERWHRRTGYTPGPGQRMMITAGANAAFLQIAQAVCDPGDEVLLTAPYYFNQEMAVTLVGARPVPVPATASLHPDPAALEAAITPRTRMIVTVSPNNPTGAVCPPECLRAVNALCAHHGLLHVHDETYEEFVWNGGPHVSPATWPGAENHTIRLFSFSKSFALAGARVGGCIHPAPLHDALRKIQDTHVICAPVPGQLAALGALRAPDSWLAERLADMAATRAAVLDGLAGLGDRIGIAPPDGAFYVWLQVPGGPDPERLAHWLIRHHRVAVIPGTAFGAHSGCWLRVAYGALTADRAAEGIGRLVEGLRQLPPHNDLPE